MYTGHSTTMTLKEILAMFGVQLEHIHFISNDGSMRVMLTQVGGSKLPLGSRIGGSGNRVLPYLDTDMSFTRGSDPREIVTITLTGGDFSDEYILYPKHPGKPVITKNGTVI